MAAFWGLDIGKHALKAVKIITGKGAPEISACDYVEYGGSPDEGDSAGRVHGAIKEFLSRNSVRRTGVVVSLPGTSAFSRIIKLPPVEAKRIEEIVRYEAQQQIPFPIDEVIWDFQQLERSVGEEGEELEVGIFAVKRELIDGFLQVLREVGIEPDAITITPLALYNFVKHEMSGIVESAVVVADIGADNTDLVVVDGKRLWIRNLAMAGNEVTRALAERFQITFEEAEGLKRKASKSPQAQKIFGVMQPVLKDFVGEIHRSVGFYKSQSKDTRIEDIFILGDSTKLVGLKNFFAQELRFEVHRYAKLNALEVGEECDTEVLRDHLSAFAVAIGLALQGCGLGMIRTNLLPREVARRKEMASKRPFVGAAVVIMLVAILAVYFMKNDRIKRFDKMLSETGELNQYEQDDAASRAVENHFSLPRDRALKLLTVGKDRRLVLDALAAIDRSLPTNGSEMDLGEVSDNIFSLDLQNMVNEKNDEKLWLSKLTVNRVVEMEEGAEANAIRHVKHRFTLEGLVVAKLDAQQRVLESETIEVVEQRLARLSDALTAILPRSGSAEEVEGGRRVELRLAPDSNRRRFAPHPEQVERNPRLPNTRQYFLFKYEFEI